MPRITIRLKLLLLSVAMLSIPYVGFQYLRETERYLQSSLEDALLAVAGALAISLQDQRNLFRTTDDEHSTTYPLFVHALGYPPHIDGYTDDWASYRLWSDRFPAGIEPTSGAPAAAGFELVVGEHDQYLNVLIEVTDDVHIYQRAGRFGPESADTVELLLPGTPGKPRRIYLGTAGPGPVTAYSITENWDFSRTRHPITNVIGEWRETDTGYVVELRLPLALAGNALGVVVHDKDALSKPSQAVASVRGRHDALPNALLRTSGQLQRMIARVGLKKGRRIWIINRSGQVLASGGSLASESKRGAINFLYTWVLPSAHDSFEDDLKSASRLRGAEVLRALNGESATRWRSSPDERAVIVSAAHPVRAGNELVGAIVVEETTNSIQTLQRDAMASLFNQSIAVFLGVSLILLLYASRLSFRIGRLRDQAEQAIDPYGRVIGSISQSTASDELGDLSRSYSTMLERLAEYNAYLESMAAKLSHELRTPLAVVSSSLQNLDTLPDTAAADPYLERAREGMARLHSLVSRLSEAARLEQSVASAEIARLGLLDLVSGCVEGYRAAYADRRFELQAGAGEFNIEGSDDLLAQLLDKLISNAVSFGTPDTPIVVLLEELRDEISLTVVNYGSVLPSAMQKQIFNSMVSLREARTDNEPHLGLGLFIARLIAEFHGGSIRAYNLDDANGVAFEVTLPRSNSPLP